MAVIRTTRVLRLGLRTRRHCDALKAGRGLDASYQETEDKAVGPGHTIAVSRCQSWPNSVAYSWLVMRVGREVGSSEKSAPGGGCCQVSSVIVQIAIASGRSQGPGDRDRMKTCNRGHSDDPRIAT